MPCLPACLNSLRTARILWRGSARLRHYTGLMDIRGSDHKPVAALLDLDIKHAVAPAALERVSLPSSCP